MLTVLLKNLLSNRLNFLHYPHRLFRVDSSWLKTNSICVKIWLIGVPTFNFFFPLSGSTYVGKAQQKGAALVNKRALNVMSCEVNRLLQLTQDGVIPVSYEVPRKVGEHKI